MQSGDTCNILELKFNISLLDLQMFNGGQQCGPTFPTTGQVICVSQGALPPTPANYNDGTCSLYKVQQGDTCLTIEKNQTFTITSQQLQNFNNASCGNSFPVSGSTICISNGTLKAPPAPPSNASTSPLFVPLLICGMLFVILMGILCFSGRKTSKD